MKIENIEIDIINIDLTRPYTIAYKTTSSIKTLVIKVILSNGCFGLGASSVSKYVVGLDTTDSYNNSKKYINKVIKPSKSELIKNSPSRSAKLRYAIRNKSEFSYPKNFFQKFYKYLNLEATNV